MSVGSTESKHTPVTTEMVDNLDRIQAELAWAVKNSNCGPRTENLLADLHRVLPALLKGQWQHQRFALNQIAWPESYNLAGLTVETCRHIARDTLQIGTPSATTPPAGGVRCFRRADGQTIEGCDRIRFRSHGTCEMVYRDDTFDASLPMSLAEAERAVSRGLWIEVPDITKAGGAS